MWISELKQGLADALSVFNAVPYRASKVNRTPTVWIENSDPFITEGPGFGEKRLNLQVTVIPKQGSVNGNTQEELDDVAVEVMELIENETDFYVTSVSGGFLDDEATGNSFAAITLIITTTH